VLLKGTIGVDNEKLANDTDELIIILSPTGE
jgi:hypothetical protein